MKRRLIIMGTTAAIAITSVGGFVFAQNKGRAVQEQAEIKPIIRNFNQEAIVENNNKIQAQLQEQMVGSEEYVNNSNNEYANRFNEYGHGHENLINIMKENGLEDMAKYMEEGNFDAMHNSTYDPGQNTMHNSMMGTHGGRMGHRNGRHR